MVKDSKEKIRVFISSICRENMHQYRIVRKSIKLVLEETGLFDVRIFEGGLSEIYSAEESYKYEVKKADLIVYIIDNDYGITDGIKKEMIKAESLKKPYLSFLCREKTINNKRQDREEQNDIQEMIDSNPIFNKYTPVDYFSDIPKKVYYAVVEAVIKNFNRYSESKMGEKIEENEHNDEIKIPSPRFKELSKEFLKGFPYTKHIIQKEMGVSFGEVDNYEEEDDIVATLLSCFMGNDNKDNVDFSLVKSYVEKHLSGNVKKIVSERYDAIEKYYNDDLEGCIDILKECIKKCDITKNFPKWIKNDIAIDLRNIQCKKDYWNSVFSIDSDGQRILNDDKEPFYYPVMDRLVADYEKDIVTIRNNSGKTSRAIDLSGFYGLVDKLCQMFIVAYVYGSLTQMQLFRRRVFDFVKNYTVHIFDKPLFLSATKLMLLDNDARVLDLFVGEQNFDSNHINSDDVEEIIKALDNHPIEFEKNIGKMLLIKHFGYYLSDSLFEDEIKRIEKIVKKHIDNNEFTYVIVPHYLNMCIGVKERVDNSRVLKIIYTVFDRKLVHLYKDSMKVLKQIDVSKLDDKSLQRYQKFLIRICSRRDVNHNDSNFRIALCHMRLQEVTGHEELDEKIKKKFPDYYNGLYSIHTKVFNNEKAWKQIEECLSDICNQNKLIEEKGAYITSDRNSYKIIEVIITRNSISLAEKNIKIIVDVLKNTIYSEGQMRSAKTDALGVISLIASTNNNSSSVNEFVDDLIKDETALYRGENDWFSSGYTINSILMHFELLKAIVGKSDYGLLTQRIMDLYESDDASNIIFLKNIIYILRNAKLDSISGLYKDAIIQYMLYSSHSENFSVRYHSASSLVHLLNNRKKKSIQFRLVNMILYDSHRIKVGLLKEIFYTKETKELNEIINGVLKESLNDSNYWVRKVAEDKE